MSRAVVTRIVCRTVITSGGSSIQTLARVLVRTAVECWEDGVSSFVSQFNPILHSLNNNLIRSVTSYFTGHMLSWLVFAPNQENGEPHHICGPVNQKSWKSVHQYPVIISTSGVTEFRGRLDRMAGHTCTRLDLVSFLPHLPAPLRCKHIQVIS